MLNLIVYFSFFNLILFNIFIEKNLVFRIEIIYDDILHPSLINKNRIWLVNLKIRIQKIAKKHIVIQHLPSIIQDGTLRSTLHYIFQRPTLSLCASNEGVKVIDISS